MDAASALRALEKNIPCAKWQSIFKQNLDVSAENPKWKFNVEDLSAETKKFEPCVATWR